MASETTVQTSWIQEDPEVESRENIPPGASAAAEASSFKVQVDDVGYCSSQPSGENEPLSETCTFSTPAPASFKSKSRMSGLQSALTPILKYLNIGNRRPSPDPLKGGNGFTRANGQSPAGSRQHPNNSSRGHSGQSLADKDAPVRWLDDEYLPEITLLDVTCDSTMQMTRNDSALPDSMPATPVKAGTVNGTLTASQSSQLKSSTDVIHPHQTNFSSHKAEGEATAQPSSLVMNQNSSAAKASGSRDVPDATLDNNSVQRSSANKSSCEQNCTIPLSESCSSDSQQITVGKLSPPKVCIAYTSAKENNSPSHPPKLSKPNGTAAVAALNAKMADTPERAGGLIRWLDDRYFPEITLLDLTRDSELSPGAEVSSMEVTQDMSPPVDAEKHSSGLIVAEPGRVDMIPSEELSSTLTGSVTHTASSFNEQSKCAGEIMKSLEVTRDISMGSVLGNNTSSLELSEQNIGRSQTSAEDTVGIHPVNVTRDISASNDMSVQCALPQSSTGDMHCNTSLKNATSELHIKSVETSNTVEANNEELCTSHDTELTSEAPQSSPKTSEFMNGTFTVTQPSNPSAPTDLNTTVEMSCHQNKTLDLSPSNVNSPKEESKATDEIGGDLKNNTGTSLIIDQRSSPTKASGSCALQSTTFDGHSLQKSSGGEGGAATLCLQNNTFDSKSNGTITLSETSSSDNRQVTMDKLSPAKVCNPTTTHEDDTAEVHPPEVSKQSGTTNTTDSSENTFEVNPTVEVTPAAGRCETKDQSQSVTDCLSDTLGHQGVDTENNNANTFNLDDTLDLKVDSLVTSTPMTHCKVFNFSTEQMESKIIAAQKKLYGDGPSKPAGQMPSDVPSNIVSDRKTLLTQPTAKSLLPPLKAASQLLKYKPTSALPGRCEPVTSSLPMTRQRIQTEALRNTAATEAPQGTTGITSSYNLRATTTASKQPTSGLPRPQLSGIPLGIQRTAPGLRLPSARSNAPASSSTDKLRGPTATNPVTKTTQPKKHQLTRGEPLPTAKRKKMDTPLPSGGADASTSSCDAVNRAKNLKQPATFQRPLPAKTQRDDAAVPASTADTSKSCNAGSRARALKQPANGHRAQLARPQGLGCTKCVTLEEQLKLKSEEIRRLEEAHQVSFFICTNEWALPLVALAAELKEPFR